MTAMSRLFTGGKMLYWVIYDISENKIRSRVASKCKNWLGQGSEEFFFGQFE
jgi:hypothetical protein